MGQVVDEHCRRPGVTRRCQSRHSGAHDQLGRDHRRAGISDAPALAKLRWRWRTAERGEHGLSPAGFEATFAEWWGRRQDSHTAYVAELDGEAVGMAWIAVFDRIPQPRDILHLAGNVQSVYVLDDLRNRGIGRALVEAVIEEARVQTVGYLIVHPSQRAYSTL